jgi:hypothetical protein
MEFVWNAGTHSPAVRLDMPLLIRYCLRLEVAKDLAGEVDKYL